MARCPGSSTRAGGAPCPRPGRRDGRPDPDSRTTPIRVPRIEQGGPNMKLRPRLAALAVAALVVVAAASGCAKKPAKTAPVPPAPTQTPTPAPTPTPPPPAPEPAAPKPQATASDLRTVFFAFDSFVLDDAARSTLDADAKLLRDNAGLNVSVDGHCDERGTVEYNQALGQKRAEAVQQYLVDQGI